MLYIVKWIYSWLLPLGGIVLALGFLAAYQRRRRSAGVKWLAAVVLVLYALSIAPVSNWLLRPLEQEYEQPAAQALDGDVIIMLGGGVLAGVPDVDGEGQLSGAAANRFLTALRLHRALGLPLLLSGGKVLPDDASESAVARRMLLSLGAAESMIYTDEESRNTAENAAFSKAICEANGWRRPIVVTSAFHMERAAYLFRREGLDITPYPCDYRAGTGISLYSFVPQASVLADSCLAIKEYAGLAAARAELQ